MRSSRHCTAAFVRASSACVAKSWGSLGPALALLSGWRSADAANAEALPVLAPTLALALAPSPSAPPDATPPAPMQPAPVAASPFDLAPIPAVPAPSPTPTSKTAPAEPTSSPVSSTTRASCEAVPEALCTSASLTTCANAAHGTDEMQSTAARAAATIRAAKFPLFLKTPTINPYLQTLSVNTRTSTHVLTV